MNGYISTFDTVSGAKYRAKRAIGAKKLGKIAYRMRSKNLIVVTTGITMVEGVLCRGVKSDENRCMRKILTKIVRKWLQTLILSRLYE